jgi:hypothetical protein
MEYWNIGFKGIGLIHHTTELMMIKKLFALIPIIPLFQFSSIPRCPLDGKAFEV